MDFQVGWEFPESSEYRYCLVSFPGEIYYPLFIYCVIHSQAKGITYCAVLYWFFVFYCILFFFPLIVTITNFCGSVLIFQHFFSTYLSFLFSSLFWPPSYVLIFVLINIPG